MRSLRLTILTSLLALLPAPPIELEQAITRHFEQGHYERAAELIEAYLAERPDSDTMHYNLACAYSRLERLDEAAAALLRAVEEGFRDFDTMQRDPDLQAIRGHEIFQAIVEAQRRVADEGAEVQLERWRQTFGELHYRYETDDEHRLNFATALDETSHREMRDMLAKQADQMVDSLFGAPPDFYVLIAVPTIEDSKRVLGEGRTAGIYQHSQRRIVSRDIGTSLRHEFFHAYHYGHMQRLGQHHPIAIQEGMAALYENYELRPDGSIVFLANERHNIVSNQRRANLLRKWDDLFTLDSDDFMDRAGAYYPQMRSVFEFVADRGKLESWYQAYTDSFDEDPHGLAAMETVFGQPLREIEQGWRDWLEERPRFRKSVDYADLGFLPASGSSNDGVVVSQVLRRTPASAARLRVGDVIVAVDGRSARTLGELETILAGKRPGQVLELRVRSGRRYRNISLQIPRS